MVILTLQAIYRRFGNFHLNRISTECELRSIVKQYEYWGFAGCIGSAYCMHQHWKKFPIALKGQYQNLKDENCASISFEALWDRSLCC